MRKMVQDSLPTEGRMHSAIELSGTATATSAFATATRNTLVEHQPFITWIFAFKLLHVSIAVANSISSKYFFFYYFFKNILKGKISGYALYMNINPILLHVKVLICSMFFYQK